MLLFVLLQNTFAFTKVLSCGLNIGSIHYRPKGADWNGRALKDKGHSFIVRLTSKFNWHKRTILEPRTLNLQLAWIPDERTPAQKL